MIDTATIFFSTLMCLVVVFRAIKLDGKMPWFGTKPKRLAPWENANWESEASRSRAPEMSDAP